MRKTFGIIGLLSAELLCTLMTVCFIMAMVTGCKHTVSEESLELREADISDTQEETSSCEPEGADPEYIYVYVCGEVCAPGVYKLPKESRIYEAIEAAGGMTEAASFYTLNQAEKLSDGQQVYVLSKEEEETQTADPVEMQEQDDGRISLNTAGKEELMTLPGIGEVRAEAIIRHREEKGGFTSIEELKEIEGIKEGVFNKVKDRIKV